MVCAVCFAVVGWKWGCINGVYARSPGERQKGWSKHMAILSIIASEVFLSGIRVFRRKHILSMSKSFHSLLIFLSNISLLLSPSTLVLLTAVYCFCTHLSSSKHLSMLCSPALWWTSSPSSTRALRSSRNWNALTPVSWLSTAVAFPR